MFDFELLDDVHFDFRAFLSFELDQICLFLAPGREGRTEGIPEKIPLILSFGVVWLES
jgi:hypothetical protein